MIEIIGSFCIIPTRYIILEKIKLIRFTTDTKDWAFKIIFLSKNHKVATRTLFAPIYHDRTNSLEKYYKLIEDACTLMKQTNLKRKTCSSIFFLEHSKGRDRLDIISLSDALPIDHNHTQIASLRLRKNLTDEILAPVYLLVGNENEIQDQAIKMLNNLKRKITNKNQSFRKS